MAEVVAGDAVVETPVAAVAEAEEAVEVVEVVGPIPVEVVANIHRVAVVADHTPAEAAADAHRVAVGRRHTRREVDPSQALVAATLPRSTTPPASVARPSAKTGGQGPFVRPPRWLRVLPATLPIVQDRQPAMWDRSRSVPALRIGALVPRVRQVGRGAASTAIVK